MGAGRVSVLVVAVLVVGCSSGARPKPPSAAGGGPAPTTPTTISTAVVPAGTIPPGWVIGDATEGEGAVFAVGSAPSSATGQGDASVVVRYPESGAAAIVSRRFAPIGQITVGGGDVWAVVAGAASAGGSVVELDAASLSTVRTVALDAPPESLAVSSGTVWVGTTTGVIERVDRATGRISGRLSAGYSQEVTGLAVTADGSRLYEAINTPLTVVEWDTFASNVLREVNLPAVAGGDVAVGPGNVWVHFATGMADGLEGLRAADLSAIPVPDWSYPDGSPERFASAVVGRTLIVIGLRHARCLDVATGRTRAMFDLPFDTTTMPWALGADGMFGVTAGALHPVAIPPSCET